MNSQILSYIKDNKWVHYVIVALAVGLLVYFLIPPITVVKEVVKEDTSKNERITALTNQINSLIKQNIELKRNVKERKKHTITHPDGTIEVIDTDTDTNEQSTQTIVAELTSKYEAEIKEKNERIQKLEESSKISINERGTDILLSGGLGLNDKSGLLGGSVIAEPFNKIKMGPSYLRDFGHSDNIFLFNLGGRF